MTTTTTTTTKTVHKLAHGSGARYAYKTRRGDTIQIELSVFEVRGYAMERGAIRHGFKGSELLNYVEQAYQQEVERNHPLVSISATATVLTNEPMEIKEIRRQALLALPLLAIGDEVEIAGKRYTFAQGNYYDTFKLIPLNA